MWPHMLLRLCSQMSDFRYSLLYYLGHRMNFRPVPFNSGGCYILSRGALRKVGPLYVKLITGKATGQCRDVSTQAEDVFTGKCLKQVLRLPKPWRSS